MKITSFEEAFDFYKRYGYNMSFPVRKRSSKKNEDGLVRYGVFICGRGGKRSSSTGNCLKPHPTMQTGCEAKLAVTIDALGSWRVTNVRLDHNHTTSPSKSKLFRCNRQLSEQAKRKLEVNNIAGIPLHKSFNSTIIEAGGYEQLQFVEKDCRNYIEKVRRLRLGDGDAAAIQAYFSKMQAQCPGFFFSLDLDDESRLQNVFWANNRCRLAYKEFGDVVTFDTTYLTNKYDMPFAPFVGVNHHGQSTLFGCGLLSNENTETFVWLFRTWLLCMEDQAPTGIITDQDRAMQNAIEIVFPRTKHRWCLWHILKKLPEKFGYHEDKGSIMSSLHGVVYESQSCDEFEHGWTQMIDRYGLNNNEWLSSLYREKCRWVPCFLKTSFWAGMSTTQRNESMNAFFDGYVHSKTSLKQFVEQYEHVLRSKVEKEFQADFRSYSQMVPCATKFAIEKQFQDVYTLSKFREFQEELTSAKLYCDTIAIEENSLIARYQVLEEVFLDKLELKKTYIVYLEKERCEVICSCHLFEFRGIICRHALTILFRNGIKMFPERYILRRWRRDVSRAYTRVKINYDGWVCTEEQVRYEQLCSLFAKAANMVVGNEQRTREVIEWIEHLLNENETPNSIVTHMAPVSGDVGNISSSPILDPICSKRKGAPRKVRQKGPLETRKKAKVTSKAIKMKNSTQTNIGEGPPKSQSSQQQQECSIRNTGTVIDLNSTNEWFGVDFDLGI